ncbi:MAG: hypothetical protein ACP5QR_02835 [Rhizomicrobium sp.]
MNLLYLLVSLAGIVVLAGLNRLLLKTRAPLLDQATAQALLELDEPTLRLRRFCGDGRSGLAEAGDGRLFAIAVSGDRLVARALGAANLAAAFYRDGCLSLRLHDYGFRSVKLRLGPDEASLWLELLGALKPRSDERR